VSTEPASTGPASTGPVNIESVMHPPAGGEIWIPPSPRLVRMRRAEVAVATLAGAGVAVACTATLGAAVVAGVVGGVVVLGVLGAWVATRRYRSWGYCERERDLLVRRGVMFRRLTVVPYGRMQIVDVKAGLAERLFRLSTVALHTAAATTDARIPGLEAAEATRLRDRLAALGEDQAAGV
jgi:membrane protein YdbS with pleckstrin-like domain